LKEIPHMPMSALRVLRPLKPDATSAETGPEWILTTDFSAAPSASCEIRPSSNPEFLMMTFQAQSACLEF
jgi:hypothetical protein